MSGLFTGNEVSFTKFSAKKYHPELSEIQQTDQKAEVQEWRLNEEIGLVEFRLWQQVQARVD
jgi:hypothetical protein